MASYWDRLRAKRVKDDVCFACGKPGHYTRDCIYHYSCYVCQGRGHRSFDCPKAKQELRAEAQRSAPVHMTTSSFLSHTQTQASGYVSLGTQRNPNAAPLMDLDYANNFRADRDYAQYAWGKDPDGFQGPIYVRGLPTFELPPVFQRLLPGDFASLKAINAARKEAFKIMRESIHKFIQEYHYEDEFIVKTMTVISSNDQKNEMNDGKAPSSSSSSKSITTTVVPLNQIGESIHIDDINVITGTEHKDIDDPNDDEKQDETTFQSSKQQQQQQKVIMTTKVNNPLALAARDNKIELARALLHYAAYAEEATQLIDIVAYNKKGVNIARNSFGQGIYELTLEGVGEGRPSVMRGDRIILSEGPSAQLQGGVVYFVNADSIVFSMPSSYNHSNHPQMDLIFILPRTQERSYHRAIASSTEWFLTRELCLRDYRTKTSGIHLQLQKNNIQSTLQSPSSSLSSSSSLINTTTSFYNFKIPFSVHKKALNEIQSDFVAKVLSLEHHVSLLWGPPGTGKTFSLVAALAELTLSCPNAKILVITPSNEAADLIVERFDPYMTYINSLPAHFGHVNGTTNTNGTSKTNNNISTLRVHSLSRGNKGVSDIVMKYSNKREGAFQFPTKEQVENSTIVIATMMTSDRLNGIGVNYDNFTHVFVDEAGHATEQLLALPLSLASTRRCKVVLAGDPKQLGPRIRSQPLITSRIQESALKRLMEDEVIWDQCGTQLIENYRSHPDIINVVNSFYDDKLVAALIEHGGRFDQTATSSNTASSHTTNNTKYTKWSKLPNKNSPILCIDHNSTEEVEKDSPSWFNEYEVRKVKEMVESLVFDEKICELSDIAVITPYSKQVQKITDRLYYMLVDRGIFQAHVKPRPALPIRVATVDSYQGREANVVILSCVRSNVENVDVDLRFQLGFLSQPERANVAISRARELLIVIGNQTLLSLDPTFQRYFQRMKMLGVILNQRDPKQEAIRDDLLRQAKEMMKKSSQQRLLNNADDDDFDKAAGQGAHEKTWVRHQ